MQENIRLLRGEIIRELDSSNPDFDFIEAIKSLIVELQGIRL